MNMLHSMKFLKMTRRRLFTLVTDVLVFINFNNNKKFFKKGSSTVLAVLVTLKPCNGLN